MDLYRRLVTEMLPDSLRKVPIPSSIFGVFKLSVSELATLAVFSGVSSFVVYSVYTTCRYHFVCCGGAASCSGKKGEVVNWSIRKDCSKVVDTVDIEEVGEKISLCRCWRSKTFPLCDGAHKQHNQDTGDNVGPVVVRKAN